VTARKQRISASRSVRVRIEAMVDDDLRATVGPLARAVGVEPSAEQADRMHDILRHLIARLFDFGGPNG
jgi:hypothetical protein